MFIIPRVALSIINRRDELQGPAFYILLGEEDFQQQKAYIGETENFKVRIKDHDYKRTFWQKALVFISNDSAMTKADVQYLQYLAVKYGSKSNRYHLDENKQIPKAPNLPEHQTDTITEFFEDIKLLTSFIGCPIFEIIEQKNKHLFFAKNRNCDASGFYSENGFIVLKGSKLAKETVPSFTWKDKREKEIEEYATEQENHYVLNVDRTFSSPSTAADFCIGSSNNGWIVWKDKTGQTLDEVYRKKLEDK
jgi:hypothetical protein